jgi:plasmid stability protein
MATVEIHDLPDDLVAKLRERAARSHQSFDAFLRSMFERASQVISVEEAIARGREIAKGSGVTADDVVAALEESRVARE